MTTYRPFLTAKRGERTALSGLKAKDWQSLMPVLMVPPRDKDFDAGGFKKTLEAHLDGVPAALHSAVKNRAVYLDISLLDSATPVHGVHPMAWLLSECTSLGMNVRPLIRPDASIALISVARAHHFATGRGPGISLAAGEWVTSGTSIAQQLFAATRVPVADLDIFLDGGAPPTIPIPMSFDREVDALQALGPFASITVGASSFPDAAKLGRGLIHVNRDDWSLFQAVYGLRAASSKSQVDYFDFVIDNPAFAVGSINPKFLSFNARLRYTANADWIVATGQLFKGQGGSGLGGAAMIAVLRDLQIETGFRAVRNTPTDDWVDAVIAGSVTPSNAEGWRKHGTTRHLLVTSEQLASFP
jgi:hypothetical protein